MKHALGFLPTHRHRPGSKLALIGGMAWGMLAVAAPGAASPAVFQTLGLAAGTLAIGLALNRVLHELWLTLPGILVLAHAGAAILSSMINGSELFDVMRYVPLTLAYGLAAVIARQRNTTQVVLGIAAAGFCGLMYGFLSTESGYSRHDATRLAVDTMNPNSLGFIAAVVSLVLLDCAISRRRLQSRLVCFLALIPLLLLLYATKSRTAIGAFLAGLFVFGALLSRRHLYVFIVGVASIVALAWSAGFVDFFVEDLQLLDGARGIDSGTGRYAIWRFVWEEAILPSPVFGNGPNANVELVRMVFGVHGAHNGFLALLTDLGVIGTLPLLALFVVAILRVTQVAATRQPILAAALCSCLVESVAEPMLLSIGNAGGLINLLLLAEACRSPKELSPSTQAEGGDCRPPRYPDSLSRCIDQRAMRA